MASDIDICNLALGNIRAGTINSLTENSVQAKQCALRYPILRDQMLQDSPWQFAGAVKPLALLVAELFDWAYVYSYPVDCLRINKLIPNYQGINAENRTSGLYYPYRDEDIYRLSPNPVIEYKIYNLNGVKVIGCNYSDIRIDYRVKITDPNLFSTNFTMALSHLLAAEIAIPIVGVEQGRILRADSLSMYESYLNAGIVNELNEQAQEIAESEYITIRT
jgi:hypothetical protein